MANIFGPYGPGVNPSASRPTDTGTPGAPDMWFAPCSSPTARDGTVVSYRWLNKILGSLRNATRHFGVTDDPASDDLLRDAILRGGTLKNVGTGVNIYQGQDTLRRHLISKIQQGSNVTVDLVEGPSGEYAIRIAATVPGAGPSGNALRNVGDGADVYKGTSTGYEDIRGIKGLGALAAVVNADNVEVSLNGDAYTLFMRNANSSGAGTAQSINGLTEATTVADADEFILQLAGAGAFRKVKKSTLFNSAAGQVIAGGTYTLQASPFGIASSNVFGGALSWLGTGPISSNAAFTFTSALSNDRYVVQRFALGNNLVGIDGNSAVIMSSNSWRPVDMPVESQTTTGFTLFASNIDGNGNQQSAGTFRFFVIKL